MRPLRSWPVAVAVSLATGLAAASARDHDAGRRPEGAFAAVDSVLRDAIAQGTFPGAVLAIGSSERLVHLRALGRVSVPPASPAVRTDTLFDLASLTKGAATTMAAMVLFDAGRLDLDAPVSRYLTTQKREDGREATVRDLLAHSAGYPPWAPLFREVRGKDAYLSRIARLAPEYEPGARSVYSDLGMIVLGALLERVTGEGLDTWTAAHVFDPLAMKDTLFRPGVDLRARIAPTSQCPWRGRLVHGEVRDENAYAMGGVAGHAGLFGTAPDLARLGRMLLRRGEIDGQRVVSARAVEVFSRPASVAGSSRTLGWELARGDPWAGTLWSDEAYGHTGLTGAVLWVDPKRDVFLVLLASVDPARDGAAFRDVRRRVSDQALSLLRARRAAS